MQRPLRPLLPLGGSASSLRAALAGIERLFGEPGAGDARANLLECGVPRRRCIIGERREPAVIRRPEPFDRNEDRRIEVATKIARQIDGIGFALACDFLKEVGFTNFSKPDVHIKEIFSQLGLSGSKDDVEVFKAVGRIARNVGVTPHEVDQLFWLVGSGDLYFAGYRLANSRAEFIAFARKALETRHRVAENEPLTYKKLPR